MPVSFDLNRLRQFLSVIDHGSIGRAAEALGVSQPTLSKSLRKLEEGVGTRLLDRGQFGARPTVFGKILAERARVIIRELNGTEADFQALRGLQAGRVAVGGGPSIVQHLLPAAVSRLRNRRPQANVLIREGLMDNLLEALTVGELDLIVGAFPDHVSELDLTRRKLVSDPVVIVCSADSPLAARNLCDLSDLLDRPWVLPAGPEVLARQVRDTFIEAGLQPPRPAVTTDSARCMVSMVQAGDYLTLLPERLVKKTCCRAGWLW